jgi:hypothetical protein
MVLRCFLALLCCTASAWSQEPATVSPAERDLSGFLVHSVRSVYQPGETKIRILLPDRLEQGRRYPVLYILPVEAADGTRWGDGLVEAKKHDLASRHGLICVAPTFAQLPWYADHPTDRTIAQESYFLKVVVPHVDGAYPSAAGPRGRLLVGFSKSGWGAWSLLLRHPDVFGKAAAWDAPLMMDAPGRYGSGPIFGTPENFSNYQLSRLLRKQAGMFQDTARLVHFGYGNFRADHESIERLIQELGIAHKYQDGPPREHSWHSGWLPEAVAMLLSND